MPDRRRQSPPDDIRRAIAEDQAATLIVLAEQWLKEHPDHTEVLFEYAEMLYKMTRYDEATQVYVDALDRFPQIRMPILLQLGQLHFYRGDFQGAERWYNEAIHADPHHAGPYVFLGGVQARLGRLSEAEATHRAGTTCSLGNVDEAYHNLGLVLRCQGRLAEAKECFESAIEIDPGYAEAIKALRDVTTAIDLQLT